jgi:hypothetical protein
MAKKTFGVNISQNKCEKVHILPWIPVGQDGLFALTTYQSVWTRKGGDTSNSHFSLQSQHFRLYLNGRMRSNGSK